MVIPFLQTSTFTGLISTANYGTSENWYSAYLNTNAVRNTTYAELTSLKAANELVAGSLYRITDFVLKWWNQTNEDLTVKNGLSAEPLLVLALSGNKISYEAKSEIHPQDIIIYDIDAISSYTWGNLNVNEPIPDFKGWILRRVDTSLNIDIGYDWRNITINCCRPDLTSIIEYDFEETYDIYDLVKENGKLFISLQENNVNNSTGDTRFWYSISEFTEAETYFPTDESRCFQIFTPVNTYSIDADLTTRIQQPTFTSSLTEQGIFQLINCKNITIDSGHNNVFLGTNIYSNHIEHDCYFNIIANNFYNNKISNFFHNNIISSNFSSNNIEDNFSRNSIYANFQYNTIGNEFLKNTIGSNCNNNDIGNEFQENFIIENFQNNYIRGVFLKNLCLSFFGGNNISYNFSNNKIQQNFTYNRIGDSCTENIINDDFASNILETNFQNNIFGIEAIFNTFKTNFQGNTVGNSFQYNNVEANASNGVDYSGATHVYLPYTVNIIFNAGGDSKVTFYNATNQLVIDDLTT